MVEIITIIKWVIKKISYGGSGDTIVHHLIVGDISFFMYIYGCMGVPILSSNPSTDL